MAQLGIDYANTDTINAPGVNGFTQAKAAGAQIIIPRAVFGRPEYGQSPVYLDAYWSRDKADIVAAGLNRSSYLFVCVPTKARPDTPSPDVQVAAFYGYVQLDKPQIGKSKRLAKIRARIRADLPHAATLPLHGHEVAVNRGDT